MFRIVSRPNQPDPLRRHTVAVSTPLADAIATTLARISEDNASRLRWWSVFEVQSHEHATCLEADSFQMVGVLFARADGERVKMIYVAASAFAVVALVLAHGGAYSGRFNALD